MKLIFATLALMSLSAFSATTISQAQLDDVALELDNICGDTWCEGDFNWNIEELRCDLAKGTCLVDLVLKDSITFDNEPLPVEYDKISLLENFDWDNDFNETVLTFSSTCEIINMNRISDVVEYGQYGAISYSQELYESVGDCTLEVEDSYRALMLEQSIER